MKTDVVSIKVENLSKKFYKDWIFKNINYTFQSGKSYAITGPNGSGKSTLLQVLSGFLPQTEGSIIYTLGNNPVSAENIYKYISLAAPYLELIEEYTLEELIDFHRQFKPLSDGITTKDLIYLLKLEKSAHKQVRNFSSGMKQRLKLGLCLFSQDPIIFLDEPTANLDVKGSNWYREHISSILTDKLVIICSNMEHEYDFCDETISIVNYQ
jgi:ABC-type multidrug transport system ATPase subunit